ncbi:type VI lipase adapter Tla3 domain-containing protein [Pseudoduganella chitinolytica]|uniref:DUF2875 family protein n=1 Tax=Pseudoduganella chitinolytica TaxID=34070 RepID=A0ABY8B507_9BURK|nr:DUF2875 family protein [Pseudoduganella chitinolytica]WEF31034.1 DUF2875 family protein [Pseudoduganella chitinolytica]
MSQKSTVSVSYPITESLEIVGVGVSVETWRNHPSYPKADLWNAVKESNGAYAISQDSKLYPKTLEEWKMMASKRAADATEVAMRDFMDRYPLPVTVVGPSFGEPIDEVGRERARESNARSFVATRAPGPYKARGEFGGLLTQSAQVVNSYLNDEPDTLWQSIFATVDEHHDLPAVALAAKDGAMHRALSFKKSDRARYEKLAEDEVFRPKQARILSDSWTIITLIKRGRIDWLRPYAPLVKDTMVVKNRGGEYSRNWSEFAGWKKQPDKPFVPTPYIAQPWTQFQIDQFDHLENLGTVHRPQVVSYLDDAGKPVKAAERTARMEKAIRAALAPLGGKLPARIFYDYGSVRDDRNSGARFVPLVQSLHAIDDDFDLLDPKRGYDLARILGDTGAGSPFVAVALASMAGRESGGAILVANLRRDDGATLLLVTPPSAEQIKRDAAIKRPYFPSTEGVKDSFR